MYVKFSKRVIDVLLSGTALILFSPIFILIMAVLVILDGRPTIFRQKRVGRLGKTFSFYKFRTMPINTPNVPSDRLEAHDLPWFCKLLRRTNLDELPQLINILNGDMSVVGPRPCLPSQKKLIELRVENGAVELRPGLTGWAQVNSFDNMTAEQKSVLDGVYASKVTFFLDIKIVFLTVGYLMSPPPKY